MSAGVHIFDYVLNDDFFAAIQGPEIEKGELNVCVTVKKANLNIEIKIEMSGTVETICDRCLEPMEVDVETDETLFVKFGKEYQEEDNNLIIIPEDDGIFNIAWILYEFAALSIPISHMHDNGECNPEMINLLHQHQAGSIDNTADAKQENNEPDPRWAALKNILNN